MSAEGPYDGILRATLAINQEEAFRGTTRMLTLPDGQQVNASIPAGIQNGQEIRIADPRWAMAGGRVRELILTISVASTGKQVFPENTTLTEFIQPPPPPLFAGASDPYSNPSMQPAYTEYRQSPPYVQQQLPPLPTVPPPMPRRRSTGLIIALVILTIFIIGSGIFGFYSGVYGPYSSSARSTATAIAQATGTANVGATSTANASATAQVVAKATTTTINEFQQRYDQVTRGTPVLNDPLTNPDANNWETSRSAGEGCSFANGTYYVSEPQQKFLLYCVARATNFHNFAYQVQMRIVKGDAGGIIFRADATNSKFYAFRIGQDGSYNFYYYPDKTGTNTQTLLDDTSPLIKTGLDQTNLITVIARNANFDLYINGKYLASLTDDHLTGGQIGLIADNTAISTEVAYSHAQVWQL